jgi:hypothetical protein
MTDALCTCTVEVFPEEVDAGAELTLTARVTGLRNAPGAIVSIRDQEGAELARAALAESEDDEAFESDDIVLSAPHTAGEHVYRAVVEAISKDGVSHELTATDFRVTVTPHAAQLNVWDVPSTIVAGERFSFTVGFRCSAGCQLAGEQLSIVDQQGASVATATLGPDTWPGTDALYFSVLEAQAPSAAGQYQWQVQAAPRDPSLPHEPGSFDMAIRVVDPPDCEVAVVAVDRETQAAIEGARVVMHPYRAVTDQNGVAKVKVTRGAYDILVSASKYVPFSIAIDVTADATARAELDRDPTWEPDEEYELA